MFGGGGIVFFLGVCVCACDTEGHIKPTPNALRAKKGWGDCWEVTFH